MKKINSIFLGENISSSIGFHDECLFYISERKLVCQGLNKEIVWTMPIDIFGRNLTFWDKYIMIDGRKKLINYKDRKQEEFELSDYKEFHISQFINSKICIGIEKGDFNSFFCFDFFERKVLNKFYFPNKNRWHFTDDKSHVVIEYKKEEVKLVNYLNYLTGTTLWQRSFEELGITRLDKFVGDVGEILVCVCDENLLLGIDKATGEVRWRVRQRVKISNILLNKVSGNLYQFYNTWECDNTDDLAEGFQLIFLEINTQTGEILYDDDIFKHPKHQVIEGLGTNEDILNWRFHKALQWGSKIYFLLSNTKMGANVAKVVAFDVILHQFTEVLDTLFYITANECWFMAEGKIFLTSKLMDKIEIEHPDDYIKGFGDGDLKKFELYFNQKLDPEKYGRVDSFRQNGNEEYYAFTKEEYLTIIDLEDN